MAKSYGRWVNLPETEKLFACQLLSIIVAVPYICAMRNLWWLLIQLQCMATISTTGNDSDVETCMSMLQQKTHLDRNEASWKAGFQQTQVCWLAYVCLLTHNSVLVV